MGEMPMPPAALQCEDPVSPRGDKSVWAQVGFYASLGFIIPSGIVGGLLIGWLLDGWLHTDHILAAVMAALGAVGGFVELLRILLRAEKRTEKDNSDAGA